MKLADFRALILCASAAGAVGLTLAGEHQPLALGAKIVAVVGLLTLGISVTLKLSKPAA